MSDEKHKALDLDELFGQAQIIKIKWQGKEYELMPTSAIGPKDALTLQKMQTRAQALSGGADTITEENAAELETMFDEILVILNKDLPLSEIPFGGKMKIIQFYMDEGEGKKKAAAVSKKQTGEKSIPE